MKSGLGLNEKRAMIEWKAGYDRMKSGLWNEKRARIEWKAGYDWMKSGLGLNEKRAMIGEVGE